LAQNSTNTFGHKSPADGDRELFNPSKHAVGFVHSIRKCWIWVSCGWRYNEGEFVPFWLTSFYLGLQRQMGVFFVLKIARQKSAYLELLIGLL